MSTANDPKVKLGALQGGAQDYDAAVSNFRIYLMTAFVAFGGFLFGYDCIIGGQMADIEKFRLDYGSPQDDDGGKYGFSSALRGAFISTMSLGTFFGALTSSFICDKWGRRIAILITCAIFSIGVLIQTLSPNLALLMFGRFLAGFGVGLVSVLIPLYQSECVPAKRRGTIVSCYQLAITIGLLIGQIVTKATEHYTTKQAYKIPIGLQFAWSGVLAFGLFFFPETPRYLIKVGKWDEAVKAKCRLTGLPPDHPHVLRELSEVKGNLEHELESGEATFAQCWQGTNLRRTLLGVFMQVWQQRNSHFITLRQSPASTLSSTTVQCSSPLQGSKIPLWQHWSWESSIVHPPCQGCISSRKSVDEACCFTEQRYNAFRYSWSVSFMSPPMRLFALSFSAPPLSLVSLRRGVPVLGSSLRNYSDSRQELNKCRLQSQATGTPPSLDFVNVRGFNTILGQVAPLISGKPESPVLGVKIAFIWAVLNFGCFAYVYFFIPELKGLELEQIDELYAISEVPNVVSKRKFPRDIVLNGYLPSPTAIEIMNSKLLDLLIQNLGRRLASAKWHRQGELLVIVSNVKVLL
jgi:MFS family permease